MAYVMLTVVYCACTTTVSYITAVGLAVYQYSCTGIISISKGEAVGQPCSSAYCSSTVCLAQYALPTTTVGILLILWERNSPTVLDSIEKSKRESVS